MYEATYIPPASITDAEDTCFIENSYTIISSQLKEQELDSSRLKCTYDYQYLIKGEQVRSTLTVSLQPYVKPIPRLE